MPLSPLLALSALGLAALSTAPAHAAATDEAPSPAAHAAPTAYALVVGSNRPGPGQAPLKYALDDAGRMADVLRQVGGVSHDRVLRLHDPDAAELSEALAGFEPVLAAHAARGEQTVFVFYYSGHARAQALDLGPDAVDLSALRAELESLGSTLTLVVLDACQSGSVSDTKGVAPAADFSTSSVGRLQAEGFAVIASSTSSELSQESPELGGSFFTHHLSTGLMGAADVDADGAVTLSEAYDYAYHRTLVDTAETAVGAQHPTLETHLEAEGALVLTRPAIASARLRFPAALDAEVMVLSLPAERVVAEVHKAPGRALDLALAPGGYQALVRGADMRSCSLQLDEGAPTILRTGDCTKLSASAVASKGPLVASESELRRAAPERLFLELGLATLRDRDDAYTERLEDFGFHHSILFDFDLLLTGTAVWTHTPWLAFTGTFGNLDAARTSRDMGPTDEEGLTESTDDFSWHSYRTGVGARVQWPLANDWLVPYAQASGGLAWTRTTYATEDETDQETHFGPMLAGAAGLQIVPTFGSWRHIGLYGQAELITAPALTNLIGDRHDLGGFSVALGLRVGG